MHHLQNRWRLEGDRLHYYGLRARPNLLKNSLRTTPAQRAILAQLPTQLSQSQLRTLGRLTRGIVVPEQELRRTPKSLSEARFCKNCCVNDYILPGLEFDEHGICPMCADAPRWKKLRSFLPMVSRIPHCAGSRFDVGLFYTGGKDSTFLLHHLSVTLGLRVLAMTWEIPFMSDSARWSIENAKKLFPNVEFVSKKLPDDRQLKFYRRLYELTENTCACPSLAYVLFYPLMVEERVPYFLAGNEPAQMLGLYYNRMAPRFAYALGGTRFFAGLVSVGRLLRLRRPLKRGQFHTLATMRHLAYGGGKTAAIYKNELVDYVVEALQTLPEELDALRLALKKSEKTGHIPAFVHMDMDSIAGGSYDWRKTKDMLVRQCGWVAPENTDKALHTSCLIERCKEYTQFNRFYHCRSRMIPFSSIELALATRGKNLSREAAIREMESALGFSLEELPECALMHAYLEGKK